MVNPRRTLESPAGRPARRVRLPRALGAAAVLAAAMMALPVTAHGQAPSPTEIRETVPLGRETCTITITSGDITMCAGQELTVGAHLQCGEGFTRVRAPSWYLDSDYLGDGDEITFSAAAGSHVLTVSCASCEDQVEVNVIDDQPCPFNPQLDALFADDVVETTSGIFLEPDPEPVAPGEFAWRKFRMRPFVLASESGLTSGGFAVDTEGGILEVYTRDGALLSLPAVFPVAGLPETLLVRAIAPGKGRVVANYRLDAAARGGERTVGMDEIRVRGGAFPGISGGSLSAYPFFAFHDAFNATGVLEGAIDPGRCRERLGLPYRAYVVAHRTPEEWAADDTLVDVSGGAEESAVAAGSVAGNTLALWSIGLDGGTMVGKPYDVVYDFGLDGRLDPGDLIDGLEDPGAYVVRDLNATGPYATTMIQYSGGTWLGQRTYYPTAIASLGDLPLVVISHGNGHDYTWYDYLGYHLASYGYLVMAHQNNTQPGIETSSTTTLTNTDYIIAHQATIAGGVLNGHIDSRHITWIGHSRGGEGVVRAYDRIFDATYVPQNYVLSDVVLISSIAPTVYLGTVTTNPHEVTYHMLFGAADGDVNGGCAVPDRQSLRIAEAAQGPVQVTYVHGAGHNDFNCCGWNDATGPELIGRTQAQVVAKSYYLVLLETYLRGNLAAREYLTRMYDGIHPSGIAANVVCADSYRDALLGDRFVIDDYQTNTSLEQSSSGGAVGFNVRNPYENRLDDTNTSFTWMTTDPMNGMTRTDTGDIYQGGVVFDWTVGDTLYYEEAIVEGRRDFRGYQFLSFRACEGTRHPDTVALNGPLHFTVTLRDGDGVTSAIDFSGLGRITKPYQRTGLGTGAGWANEFNTVRLRLSEFEADGSGLDLSNIVAVRFTFGGAAGSVRGRIGIDDLELTRK